MPSQNDSTRNTPATTRAVLVVVSMAILLLASLMIMKLVDSRRDARLLRTSESALQANPELLAYASRRAQPLYEQHCANCHGAQLQGDHRKGAPRLSDSVWLYADGEIADIEQTLLYGIRSGHPRSRNLIDMPPLGRQQRITTTQAHDVVEYVLQLSAQPHDAVAARRGALVFADQGSCYDCHGADGSGETNYGAPALNGHGNAWLYGGDRAALYKSVVDGRHGLCPAWVKTLSFSDIRALSAFIYSRAHAHASATTTTDHPGT